MNQAKRLVVLYEQSHTRRYMVAALKDRREDVKRRVCGRGTLASYGSGTILQCRVYRSWNYLRGCIRSFLLFLERFSLYYYIPMFRRKGGRPVKLKDHHQLIGLLLVFYVGSMEHKTLCSNFVSLTSPNLYSSTYVSHRQLRFKIHFITAGCTLFSSQGHFSADGLIVSSKHDCPGSWNDAGISLQFHEKLLNPMLNPDSQYGVVVYSAFPCSDEMLKGGDLRRLVPSVRAVAQRKSGAITSIRQAVEWGMGSVEKV
ncbi:Hypothetical protein PHPALM_36594 [Phytophthora palmivora]|uniref:Uncharacterized protein n=1 Tax=Phytophthora palmivora TaxID=4796 RepID=A0A2P4WZL3_9STRA|nr:Hypothetical protein PHPALM_36594 [Phytophthora palmivora]